MNLSECNKCGKCREVCPSYAVFLKESFSPRGRAFLWKALKNKTLNHSKSMEERIMSCLLCGSCINKCPLEVNVPSLVYEIRDKTQKNLKLQLFKYFSLYPRHFFYFFNQITKISFLKTIFARKIFSSVDRFSLFEFNNHTQRGLQIYNKLKPSGRIALFLGCSTYHLMPSLTNAVVNILNELNYEVLIPPQKCCGAPLLASGFREQAVKLAKKNLEVYSSFKIDGVLSPCPTCFHFLSSIYEELVGKKLRIIKFEEFIGDLGLKPTSQAQEGTIFFHNSCHSSNYLKEGDSLIKILKELSGLEIEKREGCCGFGGLFSFLFEKESMDITKQKVLEYEKAQMIITSCPNCIIQLKYVMKKKEILHYAEFINKIIKGEQNGRKRV